MAVFNPPASLETVWGGPKRPAAKAIVLVTRINNAASENIFKLFVRISPFCLNLLIGQCRIRGGRDCLFSLED